MCWTHLTTRFLFLKGGGLISVGDCGVEVVWEVKNDEVDSGISVEA